MSPAEQDNWEAPPPPESIDPETKETAQMSETATLGNIFLEPGNTFKDLRRKPRFLMAGVIVALLITAFTFALYYKVGDEGMRRFAAEQIEKNPQAAAMSAEQKQQNIDLQMTIQSVVRYVMPVLVFVTFFIGGALYWLGAKAFGGTGGYFHGLSVWVYSSLPPSVVAMIGNFIVLAFKPAEEIDIAASSRGVLQANLGMLFDGKANPVLVTLVSTLDVFALWGWVLAVIGLKATNRLSTGSATAIVIIYALIGVTFRVIGAFFSGNPS